MIGPLVFAAPLALAALAALPALWWLLRATPPRPRSAVFAPLFLLAGLADPRESPARTPWWLVLLRLAAALAVILAAAGPAIGPDLPPLRGRGPLWIVLDNGFAAAPDWEARRATAERLVRAAGARPVVIAATADGAAGVLPAAAPEAALRRLGAIEPRAWFPARTEILPALAGLGEAPGEIALVAASGDDGSLGDFAARLSAAGSGAPLLVATGGPPPPALAEVSQTGNGIDIGLTRTDRALPAHLTVRFSDRQGRPLYDGTADFAAGASRTTAHFDLPLELGNDMARAEIAGVRSASAVQLLDDRWRRRAVGVLAAGAADTARSLLSPDYYLSRALSPFANLRPPRSQAVGEALSGYLADGVAAVILADVGHLSEDEAAAARRFVEAGGVLVRFAGPRLAAADDDGLLPVPIRRGDRRLGGALSWEKPQGLGGFAATGPFAGLAVPGDVTVTRQVLADPSPDLADATWATLADGTPLVTGRRIGGGWLVLVHVTADASWSDLPLSGVFVDMLRRLVGLGHGSGAPGADAADAGEPLPPLSALDGYGRLAAPAAGTRGLSAAAIATATPGRDTPPGLYGSDDGFRALNLMRADTRYEAADLTRLPAGTMRTGLAARGGADLAPFFFAAAILLLLADAVAALALSGRLGRRAAARTAAALVAGLALLALAAAPRPAAAAQTDADIAGLLHETRLAYVVTGDPAVDEVSRSGLAALTQYLASRTSLEPGEPAAVDPEHDELSLFPLLYWPIDAAAAAPSPAAMERAEAFMKTGGTVLFDTRDQMETPSAGSGVTPEGQRLRAMLSAIDVPPLEPVPADHVLTKSFYLLDHFVGRYDGSPLWVESTAPQDGGAAERPVRAADGVSPILITGNDLAGAWAADDSGAFTFPLVPGTPEQRSLAFRAGVNIVMYVLTGSYKADQVHMPALIERLGQ